MCLITEFIFFFFLWGFDAILWGSTISPMQRPLPDNTQHSKETDIHAPTAEFELAIPGCQRPQTHALDGAVIGTAILNNLRLIS